MPKLVDNTVDLLAVVFEKIEDRILAGAFKFWFWLGCTLQITIHVPEPKPWVITEYKDSPETQRSIALLTALNDELKGENAALSNDLTQLKWALDGHHGAQPTGPSRPNNNKKLSEREVFEIRNMKRQGWKNAELARAFDVNPATVSRIVRGQYHKTQVAV